MLHMLTIQIYCEYRPPPGPYLDDTDMAISAHRRYALIVVYPILIVASILTTVRLYIQSLHKERDEMAEQALYLAKVSHPLHVIGGDDDDV